MEVITNDEGGNDVERLINAAGSLVIRQMEDGHVFNLSNLLIQREADLSRVIAWMLDPRGNHGMAHAFLDPFLNLCGIHAEALGTARVRLEVPRFRAAKSVGRVDIEIVHPSFELLIENRPTAGFGDRQLERYISSIGSNGLRKGGVVVLLGSGWNEDARSKITTTGVLVFRLGEEVARWVGACRDLATNASLRDFLNMLEYDLVERYSEQGSLHMREIVDLMMRDPDTIAASIAIIRAQGALNLAMTQRFRDMVETRGEPHGLGPVVSLPEEQPLFTGSKWGILRLNLGDPRYDFALQTDSTNFRDVAIGVVVRRESAALPRVYQAEIARIHAAHGGGHGDKPDKWWLWWAYLTSFDAGGGHTDNGPALWRWAADPSDDGLAALFIQKALETRLALQQLSTPADR